MSAILVSNLIRPDTSRLQTLKVIDDFVRQTKLRDRILDAGCGNNLYKSYYSDWDIYGVDKTFEVHTFGFVEDFDLTKFGAKKDNSNQFTWIWRTRGRRKKNITSVWVFIHKWKSSYYIK